MQINLEFVSEFILDQTVCRRFNFTITNQIEILSRSNHSITEIDLIAESTITKKCIMLFIIESKE